MDNNQAEVLLCGFLTIFGIAWMYFDYKERELCHSR
jgi:hypothetical protein